MLLLAELDEYYNCITHGKNAKLMYDSIAASCLRALEVVWIIIVMWQHMHLD